jgi:hypothetical protein
MTAVITWGLPTTRDNGSAQDPAGLDYVDVSFSADLGANFVGLSNVPATDPQTVTIPDLVDGDYVIRLQVFDKGGKAGAAVDTSFLIDTSVPGVVTNVVVDLQ